MLGSSKKQEIRKWEVVFGNYKVEISLEVKLKAKIK